PALDGLRAVSILCVLGFHTFLFPGGGFLGVDIFFVLSGFLITNLLLAERAATGRVDLRRFYLRRARRLGPALLVALAAFLAIAAVTDAGNYGTDALAAAAGVTYISNILITLTPAWVDGLRHLWSLAAEEQFYLVWPLLLIVTYRRVSRRTLTLALAFLVAALWLNRLLLTLTGASQPRLYFAPDTSLDPIVLGCLLALLHDAGYVDRLARTAFVQRRLVPACLGLALGLLVTIPNTDQRWIYEWAIPVFGVITAIVLASIVAEPASPFAALLARPRLVGLGRISYAVYLWHPILFYTAHLPRLVSVPAALVAAALSDRFVERRFRRARPPRPTRFAPLGPEPA